MGSGYRARKPEEFEAGTVWRVEPRTERCATWLRQHWPAYEWMKGADGARSIEGQELWQYLEDMKKAGLHEFDDYMLTMTGDKLGNTRSEPSRTRLAGYRAPRGVRATRQPRLTR
jgi:hypothetical protein